jgi:endoglucanase
MHSYQRSGLPKSVLANQQRAARFAAVAALFAGLACGSSSSDSVPSFNAPPPPDSSPSPSNAAPVTSGDAPDVIPAGVGEAPASAGEGIGTSPPLEPAPAGEGTGTPALDPTGAGAPPAGGSDEVPPPPADAPVLRHGQLRVEGTHLVDQTGAVVQLKGVSTMWLNWENRYSTSRAGFAWMRDNWNVSVIRAAMGVEPEGAYLTDPEAALAQLRLVVQNAIAVGIYVLIDWHDHNATEHQDEAVAFFSLVAREFGDTPNVIYEPFNEPLNIPWSTAIKPYHEAVLRAIRAEDPDNVAILGTRSWSQRVDEAALDPLDGANLMYTVHFYACDHKEYQRGVAQTAFAAGLPLFVTEWGATPADGGSARPTVCEADAQVWHDWLDAQNISWVAWKLDGCKDSSCLFINRDAPADGGWTDEWLNGHAHFVIQHLLK